MLTQQTYNVESTLIKITIIILISIEDVPGDEMNVVMSKVFRNYICIIYI